MDWNGVARELKRRRARLRLTQDMVAAKVGVRWNTIARLETGKRKPSIELLEKLAQVLQCRVRDLLPEQEAIMPTALDREPTMKGAPSYFRYGVIEAQQRRTVGRDADTGSPVRADYSHPGWHLAIHIDEYLEDDARKALETVEAAKSTAEFKRRLLAFLDQEFPGCMALIPPRRRSQFLEGVLSAIEDGRWDLRYGASADTDDK